VEELELQVNSSAQELENAKKKIQRLLSKLENQKQALARSQQRYACG
jgi:hypothetical protein